MRGVNEAYSNFHHPSCFDNYLHLMISTIDTLQNPNLKPLIFTTKKSPTNSHGVLKDTNSNLSFVTTEKVKSTTFSDFFSASQQLKMESVTFLIERCLGCMVPFFCGFGSGAHGRFLTQNHLHPLMLWGGPFLDGQSTHLAKVVVASQ